MPAVALITELRAWDGSERKNVLENSLSCIPVNNTSRAVECWELSSWEKTLQTNYLSTNQSAQLHTRHTSHTPVISVYSKTCSEEMCVRESMCVVNVLLQCTLSNLIDFILSVYLNVSTLLRCVECELYSGTNVLIKCFLSSTPSI